MFTFPDRHFSTDAFHNSKKLGAWREMISDVFFRVDIETSSTTENWSASISEVRLREISISSYATESARGIRNRHAISEDVEEFYIFLFPLVGTMYFSQYARDGVVRPGQYVMLRSSDFYNLSCDTHFDGIFLKIPARVVEASYKDAGRHCSSWRPGNPVMGKLVLSTLVAISDMTPQERTNFSSCIDSQLLGTLVAMLRAEDGEEVESSSARRSVFQRLTQTVERRYREESFSPAAAAADLRISVSYLHRCAKANSTTFSRLLRDTRLARSFEMLHENSSRLHVGEIAYLNGFSDHSVFSKIFKQRYGRTPSEIKRSPYDQ